MRVKPIVFIEPESPHTHDMWMHDLFLEYQKNLKQVLRGKP